MIHRIGFDSNQPKSVILKYASGAPFAFTEQGVAMLSSILNSERAIEVNIAIMRAFVLMRKAMSSQAALLKKLREIDGRLVEHDEQIVAIFEAIRQLMIPPEAPRKEIGFEVKEKRAAYGKGAA
ncbi:MAG: hypothetical protein CVU64_01610 [Deltaproteobacteria bacterium HGW-Deltaproteobacteria-21]|nr:MAG: hypothetical protein CVU64_01610 [Deltaproteobacteria bacterium HGW-Deltaproteobacteria-21]